MVPLSCKSLLTCSTKDNGGVPATPTRQAGWPTRSVDCWSRLVSQSPAVKEIVWPCTNQMGWLSCAQGHKPVVCLCERLQG